MHPKLNPRMLRAEPLRRCRLDQCQGACCLHGAWVDQITVQDILAHHELIAAHLPDAQADPRDWFDGRQEGDDYSLTGTVEHTTVIPNPEHYGKTVCIFFRPEDSKCALQVAAGEAGSHKWRFKPFYCILHPLDLDEQGRITLAETDLILAEPGSCLRPADERTPITKIFSEELDYLLGKLES